jgi:hypothetical protein
VFVLPFFVISRLQLRKRQKIGLWGIFSLGLINMTLSLARCIVFVSSTSNVDDASVSKCAFADYYANRALLRWDRSLVYRRTSHINNRYFSPRTQTATYEVHAEQLRKQC